MIYQLTVQQLREESVTDCVIVDVLHQAVDAVQSFPFTKVIKNIDYQFNYVSGLSIKTEEQEYILKTPSTISFPHSLIAVQ